MAEFKNLEGYADPTAYYALLNIEQEERKRQMESYQRGDIYYVEASNYNNVGSEQRAGRPAIIVSNNANNEHSNTVEVVYLTTQPKHDLPTHVIVHSTGRESTAICEQISTIDLQRLTGFCGTCTKDEMADIDIALMRSLGMENLVPKERVVVKEVPAPANDSNELIATKAQLKIMQEMYQDVLKKLIAKEMGSGV